MLGAVKLAILDIPQRLLSNAVKFKCPDLSRSFWLGASDREYEGDWMWNDGTRVARGTPFWALHYSVLGWGQEPSGGNKENCLSLDKDRFYYFNDAQCEEVYYPICQGS